MEAEWPQSVSFQAVSLETTTSGHEQDIQVYSTTELYVRSYIYTVYSGMQEWVIQIPSIPILVSVLFPTLHLKY